MKIPFDLERISTNKGVWLIAIDAVAETQSSNNILLRIILEQSVDEERVITRNLEILLSAEAAHDPARAANILAKIREWIESTDGDGFLDVSQS